MENRAIILTDSINTDIIYADGSHPRCTTFDLTFWRALLAELNTHQMIVKSSASSRAIPFRKMVSKVKETTFYPMKWQKDHSGMQGNDFINHSTSLMIRNKTWKYALDNAIKYATDLNTPFSNPIKNIIDGEGVTKQLCNRLLEPFMWHEVIATATEYENFFALRASEYAEIHFADLAHKMLNAYNLSEPARLKGGQWHLPYGDQINPPDLYDLIDKLNPFQPDSLSWKLDRSNEIAISIATARCARKSYKTLGDNPVIDYEKDIELDNSLIANGHMAPTSHPNRAMTEKEYFQHFKMYDIPKSTKDSFIENNNRYIGSGHTEMRYNHDDTISIREFGWSKQFRGFIPRRAMLSNENRVDNRVIRK